MTIKATALTSGQASRASAGDGAKGYHWHKHPDWYPNHPSYREGPDRTADPLPQNLKTIAGKQARIAEYIRLRLKKATPQEAAKELGVTRSTKANYEKEFVAYQEQQRGEAAS